MRTKFYFVSIKCKVCQHEVINYSALNFWIDVFRKDLPLFKKDVQ
jgi:hypothetical protein